MLSYVNEESSCLTKLYFGNFNKEKKIDISLSNTYIDILIFMQQQFFKKYPSKGIISEEWISPLDMILSDFLPPCPPPPPPPQKKYPLSMESFYYIKVMCTLNQHQKYTIMLKLVFYLFQKIYSKPLTLKEVTCLEKKEVKDHLLSVDYGGHETFLYYVL